MSENIEYLKRHLDFRIKMYGEQIEYRGSEGIPEASLAIYDLLEICRKLVDMVEELQNRKAEA